MVTIQKLEVQFEVEGTDEEATFGRLFQQYIRLWSQMNEEETARRRAEDSDRALGDQPAEEENR